MKAQPQYKMEVGGQSHAAATLLTDIIQEARWAAEPVWTAAEYIAQNEI